LLLITTRSESVLQSLRNFYNDTPPTGRKPRTHENEMNYALLEIYIVSQKMW